MGNGIDHQPRNVEAFAKWQEIRQAIQHSRVRLVNCGELAESGTPGATGTRSPWPVASCVPFS